MFNEIAIKNALRIQDRLVDIINDHHFNPEFREVAREQLRLVTIELATYGLIYSVVELYDDRVEIASALDVDL